MQIIGLSGFARAGKDETAKVLVEEFGFTQVAFADKLRDMIYALNPIVEVEFDGDWAEYICVQDVIDEFGWGGYKETAYGDEIRRLLQRLGTEAGRQTLWDTIWIDAAFAGQPQDAKIVVSDARFFNEFDAIRQRGGEIWRVERPGVGPANDHASELEAVDYNHFAKTLHNSRDLDFLKEITRSAYADFAYAESQKLKNVAMSADGQLYSKVPSGHPLAPKPGDGSITSVNVPKRRA